MPRTKGAKDAKPRRMNPASLATLSTGIPGFLSASVRIYGPSNAVRWFKRLDSRQRGEAVNAAQGVYQA